MDWKQWAIDYKEQNKLTYRDLCAIVNDEFGLILNHNTLRREIGDYKREKEETRLQRFDLLQAINSQIKPLEIEEYKYINKEGSYLVEPCLMDLHIGKMAWIEETGNNYDHKIVQKIVGDFVNDLLYNIKDLEVDEFLLPVGNDLLNFDDTKGNTTGGTQQDNDVRWQKMYVVALECMTSVVESLREIAPVRVTYVSGNHDRATSFYLVNALEQRYHNNSNVIVDASPKKRKYFQYYNNLIGFSHAETEKKRLEGESIMAVEAPASWGRTKYREWHLGHLHTEMVWERGGVTFRRIPSLSADDAWHFESGYVGSIRRAQTFFWTKQNGLKRIEYFNL